MVKLAISVLFAAALASVVAAQDAGAVFEEVNARDIAPSAESDLFGRAAAKVMSDLFSREELTELLGREVDGELSQRDIDELFEREVEVNGLFEREIEVDEATALAAREAAGVFVADVEAREEGAEGEGAEAAPAAEAPKEAESKPKSKPQGKGKDVEAKPKVNKNEHSLFGSAMRFFSNLFNPKAKAAADAKKKGADAKAKTAPAKPAAAKPAEKPAAEAAPAAAAAEDNAGAAPAEGESQEARDVLFEEPVERSFGGDDDAALNEARELMEDLEEVFGRDFELEEREFDDNESVFSRDYDDNESVFSRDFDDNESVYSRDFDDDESVYGRDFNDELVEREFDFDSELAVRDFEDELLGREFDDAVLEQRDFDDLMVERGLGMEEWDEELLRRAFDVVQELEQLD